MEETAIFVFDFIRVHLRLFADMFFFLRTDFFNHA